MNHLERGVYLKPDTVEAPLVPSDKRHEARDLLLRSPYIKTHVGNYIHKTLMKGLKNPVLFDNTLDLLRFSDKEPVRVLIEQRMNAPRVDMMEEANRYTDEEMKHIVERMRSIQLCVECTVGCPWCGAMATRKRKDEPMSGSVSLESFESFVNKFGMDFPNYRLDINYASDPFDWMDEKGNTYSDIAREFGVNTNLFPFTSTAVPEGSEFVILEYLKYMKDIYNDKQMTPEMKEVMKRSFRFSRTKQNSERVDKILAILKDTGFSKKFIKEVILDEEKDTKDPDRMRKVGHFINHKSRGLNREKDISGIYSEDETYYAPHKGFVSGTVECVTSKSPTGMHELPISPGRMELPKPLSINPYRDQLSIGEDGNLLVELIPEVECDVFENGKLLGTKTVGSVRRDVLTFNYIKYHLDRIEFTVNHKKLKPYFRKHPDIASGILRQLKEKLWPKVAERKNSCLKLCENETDSEAVRIATGLINEIDEWFAGLDSLGLGN